MNKDMNKDMNRKEIVSVLNKYYVNYDKNKWIPFLDNKKEFNQIWKNEHGGYITKEELKQFQNDISLPKVIPYIKNNIIVVTETVSNDKKFHKKYIKTLNNLLLDNDKEHMTIDLRNNGGGKPEVMFAGLLPIFNMTNRKILTYIKTRNSIKKDIIKNENCIISIVNDNSKSCGTKRKLTKLKELTILYDEFTASSAEQLIIGLKALSSKIKINLVGNKVGNKTAGFTTSIKWIELPDGSGIEIPYGYMVDVNKKIYKKGI